MVEHQGSIIRDPLDEVIKDWPPMFNSTKKELELHVQVFRKWWHRTNRLDSNYNLQIHNEPGFKGTDDTAFNIRFVVKERDENGRKIMAPVLSLREATDKPLHMCYWWELDADEAELPSPDSTQEVSLQEYLTYEISEFVTDFGMELLGRVRSYEEGIVVNGQAPE